MVLDLSPGSPEWRSKVTASKVAAILGESPYSTPALTWASMRGDVPHKPIGLDLQIRGAADEIKAVRHFWEVRNPTWTKHDDEHLWTRDDAPWAACNTDSHGVTSDGVPVLVEAKSVGRHSRLEEWGQEEGTDDVPTDYWLQAMFQMWVSGIRTTYVERVGPYTDEFRSYVVNYDERIAEEMASVLERFHASLSDDNAKPEPTSPKDRAIYARNERIEEVSWEIDPAIAEQYVTNALAASECADLSKLAAARILHAMGDAKYATVNGHRIARRQKNKSGTALYRIADSVEQPVADAA